MTAPPLSLPRLAVLIPVRDDAAGLARCLRALARQDLADCEILVGDDGSRPPLAPDALLSGSAAGMNPSAVPQGLRRDSSSAPAPPSGLDCRLFRCEARGPAATRNRLAREARAEHLVFLDADTEPHDDLLARIRAVLDAHPDVTSFIGSYDDDPGAPGLVSSYRNLLHHHVHQSAGDWVSSFWCGCGVIRRSLFLEHGGLDESYTEPSVEDIELGLRLARSGLRTRVIPELQVKHYKAWTLWGFLTTDLFRRGIPWVRLLRSRHPWPVELNLGWRHRVSALSIALLAASIVGRSGPGVAASAAAFTALNLPLFALVARARDPIHALAAWPLHALHTAVSILSVPLGLWPAWATPGRRERGAAVRSSPR